MKIIGIIALCFSGAHLAALLIRKEEDKTASARALCGFIAFVKNMIECFSLSISEILLRMPEDIIKGLGVTGTPESLEEIGERESIEDGESKKIFHDFYEEFGKCYRDEQIRRCAYFLDIAQARQRKLERELVQRRKLIITLCSSAVILLIILLA